MKKLVSLLLLAPFVLCGAPAQIGFWQSPSSASVTFSDDFLRADENPLSKSGAWTTGITGVANLQIVSHLVKSTTGGNAFELVGTPSYASNANQESTITLGSTGSIGTMVRCATSGNGYLLWCNAGSKLQFYKITGGSAAQIGSDIVQSLVTGHTISLRIVGTTLTAYYDGVSKGTTTDSTYATGSPGCWSSNSSSTITAFSCTSI